MITTIQLDTKLKTKLDSLKIHHRETYNDLISRLINNCSPSKVSRESLIETIEVLSDPEAMKNIAEALQEIEKGEIGVSLEELEKELGF